MLAVVQSITLILYFFATGLVSSSFDFPALGSLDFLSTQFSELPRRHFRLADSLLFPSLLSFPRRGSWSDATASIVSRIASITVLTSILRPREAYRQQLRINSEREAEFFAPVEYASTETTGCSTCVCGRPKIGTSPRVGTLVLGSMVGVGVEGSDVGLCRRENDLTVHKVERSVV